MKITGNHQFHQTAPFTSHDRVKRPCQTAIEVQGQLLVSPPLCQRQRTTADPNRTELFAIPASGLVRSPHGTIEMVVQKGGRVLSPYYNAVGILQSVRSSDGLTFTLSSDRKTWCIVDRSGRLVNTTPIKSVYFDKRGNLIYIAVDGCRTVMTVEGKIVLDHVDLV